MKINKYVFIAILLLFSFESYSQSYKYIAISDIRYDTYRRGDFYKVCDSIDKVDLSKANCSLFSNEYKEAFRLYKRLSKHCSSVYLKKKCGDVLILQKKYKKALKYLDDVIERDSLYYTAYLSKIKAYHLLGSTSDVKFVYDEIENVFSKDSMLVGCRVAADVLTEKYVSAAKRIINISNKRYKEINHNSLRIKDGQWFDFLSSVKEGELDDKPDLARSIVNKETGACYTCSSTYIKLIKKYPNSVAVAKFYLYKRSNIFRDSLARDAFEKLEKNNNVSFWQYWIVADIASRIETKDVALNYYNKAINLNDTIPKLYYSRACINESLKDYQAVYDDASKAISLSVDIYHYYCERAFASIEMGDAISCINDARKALSINNKATRAHTLLYRAYLKENKLDSALYHVEKNIENIPFDKRYLFDRARVYKKKHDLDNVIDSYNRVLKLDKHNKFAIRGLVNTFVKKHDYSNAVVMQERLLKISPNNESVKDRYISLLVLSKKHSEALDYIESILAKDKGNKVCITKLSLFLDIPLSKAIHDRASLMLNNPKYNSGESFISKAREVSFRNSKLAIQYLDKALSMGVDISMVAAFRFLCLRKVVEEEQYVMELNKFIKKYPESSDLQCVKGVYFVRHGKKSKGLELLNNNIYKYNDKASSADYITRTYFEFETDRGKVEKFFDYKISRVKEFYIRHYYQYMVRFYIRTECYTEALSFLDKLDEMRINDSVVLKIRIKYTDRYRLKIYEKTKQTDKLLELKKKYGGSLDALKQFDFLNK